MTITDTIISHQRAQVFGDHPKVNLVEPCRIGNGILQVTPEMKGYYRKLYNSTKVLPGFFIPASGSGSRMFQFLYDFIEEPNDVNRGQVERFLNHLEDFAFYRKIDRPMKDRLENGKVDLSGFVRYIVSEEGLGLGMLPKGLVPFHYYGYFILNPFQEHVLQAATLNGGISKAHFTVNPKFKKLIADSIEEVRRLSGYDIIAEFSCQDEDTDSIAFSTDGDIVEVEPGRALTRPSGHGALLDNLNEMDDAILFIKNIDNVQHGSVSEHSMDDFRLLGGILLEVNEKLRQVVSGGEVDREALKLLISEYQLAYSTMFVDELTDRELIDWMNRPRRVCGMVKNEGQPGGGPFWVKNKNGKVSKQIVEKAQISNEGEQFTVMVKSSHFNPVMLACDVHDLNGNKLNLKNFRDDDSYFVVRKRYHGKDILFAEQPGLWNGGMADWMTVFVEVSSLSFSPVKTVLDLLDTAHR